MTTVGRATPLMRTRRFLIIVVLALILSWQLGVNTNASQLLTINGLAIDVLQLCQDEKMLPQDKVTETPTSQTAWLLAAAGQCQENSVALTVRWQQVLALSDERLPALRSLAPYDRELAQYAVTLYPARGEAHFFFFYAYLTAGENQPAADAFAQGLALDPSDGLIWRKLGDLYQEDGDWQAVVRAFDQACFRMDRGKNGCPRAGGIYMQQGQYELAAQRYRQSIKQLPYWLPAKKGLVEALLTMGQQDEAVPYLEILAESGDEEAAQQLEQIKNGRK